MLTECYCCESFEDGERCVGRVRNASVSLATVLDLEPYVQWAMLKPVHGWDIMDGVLESGSR